MSDSIEWTWRDETIRVGIDHRGQGPTVLMLPALSSISTRSEMRPLAEKLASIFTTIESIGLGSGTNRGHRLLGSQTLSRIPSAYLTRVAEANGHSCRGSCCWLPALPGCRASRLCGCLCLVAPTWRGPLPTMTAGRRTMFRYISRLVDLPVIGSALYRLNVNRPMIRDGPRTRLCRSCLARRASPRRETCGDQCAGRSGMLPSALSPANSILCPRTNFYSDRASGYRSYSRVTGRLRRAGQRPRLKHYEVFRTFNPLNCPWVSSRFMRNSPALLLRQSNLFWAKRSDRHRVGEYRPVGQEPLRSALDHKRT